MSFGNWIMRHGMDGHSLIWFSDVLVSDGGGDGVSLSARTAQGNSRKIRQGMCFEAAKIFALNIAIALFPDSLEEMRVYGVLTRIALCYLVAGLLLVAT